MFRTLVFKNPCKLNFLPLSLKFFPDFRIIKVKDKKRAKSSLCIVEIFRYIIVSITIDIVFIYIIYEKCRGVEI